METPYTIVAPYHLRTDDQLAFHCCAGMYFLHSPHISESARTLSRVHAYTFICTFDISDYMQLINSPFIAALTYVITNFLLFQQPLITIAKCPRCQTEQVCCKFLHKYSAHARTHTPSLSLSFSVFLFLSFSLSLSFTHTHSHTRHSLNTHLNIQIHTNFLLRHTHANTSVSLSRQSAHTLACSIARGGVCKLLCIFPRNIFPQRALCFCERALRFCQKARYFCKITLHLCNRALNFVVHICAHVFACMHSYAQLIFFGDFLRRLVVY